MVAHRIGMCNLLVAGMLTGMRVTRDVVLTVGTELAWELLTDRDELATWLGHLDDDGSLVELDGTRRHVELEHVEAGRSIRFVWWDDHGAASRVEITVD